MEKKKKRKSNSNWEGCLNPSQLLVININIRGKGAFWATRVPSFRLEDNVCSSFDSTAGNSSRIGLNSTRSPSRKCRLVSSEFYKETILLIIPRRHPHTRICHSSWTRGGCREADNLKFRVKKELLKTFAMLGIAHRCLPLSGPPPYQLGAACSLTYKRTNGVGFENRGEVSDAGYTFFPLSFRSASWLISLC